MKLGALVLCAVGLFTAAAQGQDLIGGRVIDPSEMPSIVYVRQGTSRCSATLVGRNVILTAAHCVPDHGEIGPVSTPVEVTSGSVRYSARCRQAPAYRSPRRGDHDMALCKVDRNMPQAPAHIAAEGPELGEVVLLTGYGCIQGPAGRGGNDGKLRIGEATVTKLPRGSNRWFNTEGNSALCFGDSGSSAWSISKGQADQVLGVNSRGDIRRLSLLTSLSIPESKAFLLEFQREQGVRICGVASDC